MLTVMLAGVIGKRPVVLSFLNDWLYEVKAFPFSALKSLVCKLVVKSASIVIFKSPVPDELSSSDKVFNLPNGVDSEFFNVLDRSSSQSALGLDRSKKYLLFVSSKNQYRKQKRYDIFKKVFDRVRQLRPDLAVDEIVMVGQARQVVPVIFSAAAVHVLTSDYEGSPNSVKESMCCGTPVVARDVGNVRDMLAGLPGAAVTRSADVDEISEAVIRLLDEEIDPSVVREGFLSKGITKQLIANRLVTLYEAAISSRRK
jgi:glycosyltransferase involved in cell wall biosynthesis